MPLSETETRANDQGTAMKIELRKTVVIQPGGVIEIREPQLQAGSTAEVIVNVNDSADRVRELSDLFDRAKSIPAARTITEDEIAAEVEAYRVTPR